MRNHSGGVDLRMQFGVTCLGDDLDYVIPDGTYILFVTDRGGTLRDPQPHYLRVGAKTEK